jgi:heterotetrameric sarcosine oxidase gamma subunit
MTGSGAVTDVSGGRMAVRLAGADARGLFAKDCPLDLHPRAFKPGTCAQSVLAKVSTRSPTGSASTSTAPGAMVCIFGNG